jgi:hypothetical protein
LQDVWTMWQHFRMLLSVQEYFGSPLLMRKGVTALTIQTLGQAVRMRSCFWVEYRYSGKAVAEDRLDAAK